MLYDYLGGAATMGFLISALFFFRFWRCTDDGLFLAFGIAFTLLGANQALLILADVPEEERSWLYLLRLAAFILILTAIIRKNRKV